MNNMVFKVYAIAKEIDLNKIAIACGIPKKYTWEEPLCLQNEILSVILDRKTFEEQKIFVFSFGSIVLINLAKPDINVFIEYLKNTIPDLETKNYEEYTEDYELHIENVSEIKLTDKYVIVPKFETFYPELISTVISKSVALEKTEYQLGKILDNLENIIDRLEKGRIQVGNKELARTTSSVVRHEYNTIAYIMILDKPDITWINSDAALFYERISEFFELNDRYEILKQKTHILNNIVNGFSSISHSIRGLFLEWIIIILILVEIVLMFAELFKG